MQNSLAQVISINEENCVNCHKCISVCPVKFCIDGSDDHVSIRHDMCIGCGHCIEACEHEARGWLDDTKEFIAAARKKRRMIGIVAPSVAASFSDTWPRLLGFLRGMGVEAFFDVSLGAELTVKSYLDYVEQNQPRTVIAQPCPAIVSYVEIYRPELLPYLAPADSPMLHTVKMIREYWPEYDGHELVVLSPCLAKRREFDETETTAFNVTYRGLLEWLDENDVDLTRYPEEGFTGPPAERAARFSTPGGLMLTAERDAPGISARTKKIEGTGVYGYLDSLTEAIEGGYSPLMIDCLNCEKGCNGGPGTEHQHTAEDLLAKRVDDRIVPLNSKNKTASRQLWRDLKDYWKPGIFSRSYHDRSGMVTLKKPTNSELDGIYEKMRKTKPEDFLHCASCGYGNCEQMAVAIHNGLNRRENCHQYRQEIIWQEKKTVQNLYVGLHEKITGSETLIKDMTRCLERVNLSLGEQGASLEESSASIEQMMATINNLSRIGDERRLALDQLVGSAQNGEEDLKRMVTTISQIAEAVQGIGKMVGLINGVAARTSLLSMNAAIEAAHAGDAGLGFAVVAEEVRKLAEATEGNVKTVGDFVTQITERAREGSEVSGRTGDSIGGMIGDIHELNLAMRELLNHTDEMSTGSLQITSALGQLTDLSGDVKTATGEMSGAIMRLEETLGEVLLLSERNMEQINALSGGDKTDISVGLPA